MRSTIRLVSGRITRRINQVSDILHQDRGPTRSREVQSVDSGLLHRHVTDGIRSNCGSVYQYAGDEVVLSWPKKQGIEGGAAIRCFFAIRDYLDSRKDYYKSTYGVQPVFKAGVHVGWVTVAEVGVLKREISYHGDTLNTAARIEGRCNDLQRDLLISGSLAEAMQSKSSFGFEKLGDEELRGKQKSVTVFGLNPA